MDKIQFNKALSSAFSASLLFSALILIDSCTFESNRDIVQKQSYSSKKNTTIRDPFGELGKLEGFTPCAEDFDTIREEVKEHIFPYLKDSFYAKKKCFSISKKALEKVFKQELQLTGELSTAVEKAIDGAHSWRSPTYVTANSPIIHFIIKAIATCHYLEHFCSNEIDNQQKKALQTFLDNAPYRVSTTWDINKYYLGMNGYGNKKIVGLKLINRPNTSESPFNAPKKLKEAEKIMEEALRNFSQAIQLYQLKT